MSNIFLISVYFNFSRFILSELQKLNFSTIKCGKHRKMMWKDEENLLAIQILIC